ncbi:hypothetical protein EV715DRAFT_257261 [Schizophyllum commune]
MSQQPLYNGKPGVKITFSGADKATALRPMSYRRAGVDENSFNTPPASLITALPCIRGKKIPYERYTTFCQQWLSDSILVFYAEAARPDKSAPRQRFALKVAFDVAKGSSTPGGAFMETLRLEALLYQDQLAKLQGVAVPKHYGVWIGRTSWDTTVACTIMEWGGKPYSEELVDPKLGKPERSVKIMEALKALHDAGICHNDLIDLEIRHILYDTRREKAFIVDFSTAERHKCHLKMKMAPYTTTPPEDIFGCDELWYVGMNVDYFGDGPDSGPDADPRVVRATLAAYQESQRERRRRDLAAAIDARRLQASKAATAQGYTSRPGPVVAPTHK